MRAAHLRIESERRFTAAMTANMMNCHPRKHPVTVDQLLGLGPKHKKKSKAQLMKEAKKRGRTYADYLKEHGRG